MKNIYSLMLIILVGQGTFAQSVTLLPSSPSSAKNNGGLVWQNTSAVTATPISFATPVSGVGTRLMWMPAKSAFRVGTVTNDEWNFDNIGTWSFASGYGTIASSNYSTAMGSGTKATEIYATALGENTTSDGEASTAMGYSTGAYGYASTAMGTSTQASGNSAIAMGSTTNATGNVSTALGKGTTAQAYGSLVIGRYNVIAGDQASWVNTDPIFVIGNGTTPFAASNSLLITKAGSILATGDAINGATPASGAGNRMMWIPQKAAFRAGNVDASEWDDNNIGNNSVAAGQATIAKGITSTAFGSFTSATGPISTAMGRATNATGNFTTALGYFTTAQAFASTAVGAYNTFSGDAINWVATDPIFVVGNGTENNNIVSRSNALTILKNENTGILNSTPTAVLDVTRGNSSDASSGTAAFRGTTYVSHFNYDVAENTYIRGGLGILHW